MNNTRSPLFEGQSSDRPTLLSISFASDPTASLGVSLSSHDNNLTNEMFLPGYASIGAIPRDTITTQNTLASKLGVKVGDYIVEVNGEGFRRFPPDFPEEELEVLGSLSLEESDDGHGDLINLASIEEDECDNTNNAAVDDDNESEKEENGNTNNQEQDDYSYQPSTTQQQQQLKSRVLHPNPTTPNQNYNALLTKIRQIKSLRSSTQPLQLTLERYEWDSRVHSWSRFLSARRGNVPQAMMMIMAHERWRQEFFPVDLTEGRLQEVLRSCAVSEVDVVANSTDSNDSDGGGNDKPAVVYIDLAKLQMMMTGGIDLSTEVVQAFVVHTETLLSRSPDPRSPKTSQMVDLTGVNLKQGLKVNVLKKLYRVFEPNYPETLHKMVLYPVPKTLVSVVNAMLSFVNVHTRQKFVITDDLFVVCKELGWNLKEIEEEGGIRNYMEKHLTHGRSQFVFD